MRQPLTRRQREILDWLAAQVAVNGYAPSLEEIARQFKLSSLATVHKHLQNLQHKGFIRRAFNRSRAMEILPPPDCCPTCGRKFDPPPADEAKVGEAA